MRVLAVAVAAALCVVGAVAVPATQQASLSPQDSSFQFKFKQVGAQLSNKARKIPIEDDEMTYRIVQTVKGSYSSLGPLQCESTCAMKAPTPQCKYEVPDCAVECKDRCSKKASTMFGFRNKVCVEGCRLFCDLNKDDCCPDKKKDEL